MARPRNTRLDGGVALIAVLWLLAVLAVLAATVATLSISSRREVLGTRDIERLQLLADSAIRLTLLNIIAAPRTRASPLSFDGELTVFDTRVTVDIELENGRIDLNAADDDLLVAFFSANGQTERQARILAARIADWKDADDTTRADGAELAEYSRAGKKYAPRNAPFEAVEELRQVLGAEHLGSKLLDSFTVYTHLTLPAEMVAPAPVKTALMWADAHELGGHPWHRDTGGQAITVSAGDLIGQIIRVHACAHHPPLGACREAVVRPVGQLNYPFQGFLWHTRRWE